MGKMNIEQFREQHKPAGGSKLDAFCTEILELHKEGYSLDQIMRFLSLNDIQIARSTLHNFIKKKMSIAKAVKTNSLKNEKVVIQKNQKKTAFKDFNPPVWASATPKIDDLI